MEKFLAGTARYILEKHGNNLSDVSVLMPNHRSCVYFMQALKDASRQTIWSPEISTLQDWVIDQSELALIEPLEQLMELFEVYKNIGGEDPFDEFIPVAQTMLSDFEEVDIQLANARSFFNYLEKLKSLTIYEPGGELSEYSIRYKRFWQLFRELYFGFRERLLEKKKGYNGMIFREVAERMSSVEIEASRIYLLGFSGLNKAEEVITKALLDKDVAEIIWDADNYYVKDNLQEAGTSFRKYEKLLKVNKSGYVDLIASQPKNINIIGVARNIGQTRVVADVLVNKLKVDDKSERQTAVIVPDEKLLNPLLAAMPDSISALNISMGYPLNESPIAEFLRSVFLLHDNVQRLRTGTNKNPRFHYRYVFDLLHHPYAIFLIPDKKIVSSFIENIRERNWMLVTGEELKTAFSGTEYEKLFWYTDDSSDYLNRLLELLECLRIHFLRSTRSGRRDLNVDIELLYHVNKNLNNLKNVLDKGHLLLSSESLRKLVMENIRSLRIPFDGEPVRGLQIMGMLETRCLDFKNVIILSMNEGVIPSGKTQRSYIPYEMRKEFLSTHHDRDATSAYLFYRLLQRAESVYLLYNTESDEMGGGERSRYILQLQHELQQANPKAVINDYVYSVDAPAIIPENEIAIFKDAPLMSEVVENLTGYGISPSAINTYINCSLQYYLRYVAGFREEEDLEESMEASTLGSAVHYVLENLYQDGVDNKTLTHEFITGIARQKDRIDMLLKQYLAKRFDKESLKRGKNYLLYRVCLKLIDEFLKEEKRTLEIANEAGIIKKLLMLEKEMVSELAVKGVEIKIRGKVDRVEESNGIISVVDYKTGTPVGSSIKSDDIALFSTDPKYAKAMQLMMYAWLYWRNSGSPDIRLRSGIYWLRDISKGFDPLKMDKDDVITPEVLIQFEDVLTNVLAELLDPGIPFTKTSDIERCTHCEFVRICRRE